MVTLLSFKMFSSEVQPIPQNIAIKYVATEQIEYDLLHTREKGQELVENVVEEWLLSCEEGKH